MKTEKLKVLMLAGWYPYDKDPQMGVFIRKHAKAISLQHDVAVIHVRSEKNQKEPFRIHFHEEGRLIEIIVYFRKSNRVANVLSYVKGYNLAREELRKKNFNPQILHSYILHRTALIAWLFLRKEKLPHVISEQWSGYLTGNYAKQSFFIKKFSAMVAGKAAAVTAVSGMLMNKMKAAGLKNDNYIVIPNVIKHHQATPQQDGKVVRVLMVADLVDEVKNISGVIKMISQLGNVPLFRLDIIGHGKDETKLKKLAEEHSLLDSKIFFHGLKNNDEVYESLSQCNFLLMNSRVETFSLICAEAMSCGKPVLATRCGGPDEFVTPETGVLIQPDQPDELREQFVKMLSDYRSYSPQAIAEYAAEKFSEERIAMMFSKVYTETSGVVN